MGALANKSQGDYQFTIDSDDFITYATAFNGKSIIRSLKIKSSSPKVSTNVVVEVSIRAFGNLLAQPWIAQIGTLSNKAIGFENLSLEFFSELLFQQSETVPAELKIRLLEEAENLLCEVSWNLDLFSPDTWLFGDSTKEILSAYVQPNDPILRGVLDDAISILRKTEDFAALSGYQVPRIVRPLVTSIYQALVNRHITYSNPPASWDLPGGQRIRNAQKVLEEKVGTCLDTAVLFASLLEASGLHPVIAVIPGHAFVGYWTAEYYMEIGNIPLWTELPISEIVNLIDAGYIELFETTTICKSAIQIPYQEAIKESHARISITDSLGSNSSISSLINVSACRMMRPRPIRPLPATYKSPDGATQIIEYQPIDFSVGLIKKQLESEGVKGKASSTLDLNVPAVVKRWLDSLLDLSLRNPLINFKGRERSIEIVSAPGFLGLIEDLLQNNQTLTMVSTGESGKSTEKSESGAVDVRGELVGNKDATAILSEALSKKIIFTSLRDDSHKSRLRKLASNAKTFAEETGSNGLYMALGTLTWNVDNSKKESTQVVSPLILVPVHITSKNRGREFFLSIDEGNQVVPNFSLAEKLRRDHGVVLDKLVNLVEDESGVDVDGTFDYVRKTLAGAGLNNFRVDEKSMLGIFNFSTYRMWRDLLDNWKTFETNSLVNHFINSPNQEFKDPSTEAPNSNLDDLVSRLPIPSDASQARAISLAMAGKTFILQGPPGTGKSQTITNLLARALSEGKRVLFVAQKKDALDVVKKRLDEAGLGAFSLDLHDKAMSPKAVKEQLAQVIDIAIASDQVGYETARGEYEEALSPLQKYRNRLHEVGKLGESIYSALDKKLAIKGSESLPISGEFISNSTIEMKNLLHRSSKIIADLGPQTGTALENPWSFSRRTEDFSENELSDLRDLVTELRSCLENLKSSNITKEALSKSRNVEEILDFKTLTYPEAKLLDRVDFTSRATQEAQSNSVKSLDVLNTSLKSIEIDVSRLDSLDIDSWISKAHEANTAFALIRSSKQGSVLKKVSSILGSTITTDKTKIVEALEKLKSLKIRKKQAEQDLANLPGYKVDLSENLYSNETIERLLETIKRYQEITQFLLDTQSDKATLTSLTQESNFEELMRFIRVGELLKRIFDILVIDENSISLWRNTSVLGEKIMETAPKWAVDGLEHSFSQLTRWVTLNRETKVFKDFGLESALHQILLGKINFIDVPSAFLNGYYDALGKNLVVERGFNTFEAMTINSHIKNLEKAHLEIRDRLPRITGAELLARRGFGSSMKVGAIGDLVAAIKQPKSRMPIRSLLSRNWGVITKVTPCVLASPDSCVRFIDASLPPFDLVVFDEASQIRVAHAIGAIGRSKAVIVVGDSKQMPPTSVAQVRAGESDEEEQLEDGLLGFDMESILDHCETARIPDIMLNWHYRSADESLIAFSNKKYYDGRLNSFPSPTKDKSNKGLSFEYVPDGQFLRPENRDDFKNNKKGEDRFLEGTNSAEIDAILNYLSARLKNPETQNDSIGIVTFNMKQREEIEARLDKSNDPEIQKAWSEGVGGEEIFVKNLESVQGSERDVILFSVAFSKNLKGELPLNFGPLNNTGGERRLNVAITRARKQVRVFCSFKPDELLHRKPTAVGVAHLAQFLQMANKEDESLEEVYITNESHPDRTRKQILEALRDAGLNAVEEVGLSDFKVDIAIYDPRDSSKAILGILLDGPRWNSRETVSDRDCLSVSLLRDRMGWPAIERIWLASWLRNPVDEVERIKRTFESVLTSGNIAPSRKIEKKISVEPIFTSLDASQAEESENPIDRLLQEVEEWTPIYPQVIADKTYLDYLYDSNVRRAISDIAIQLTEHEGPVSPERFAKFVGGCFGLERVVASRVEAINEIPFPGQERDIEGFLFPSGKTPITFELWRRGTEASLRKMQDISISEISNAMKAICEAAHGVRPEQLNKEVSRLFGVSKVSAAVNQRLDNALKFGLENGRLVKNGDYIQAAPN